MSAGAAANAGAQLATQLMEDECSIWTGETSSALNEETLEYEPVETYSYVGVCRVRFTESQAAGVDAAGQLMVEQRAVLSIPIQGSGSVAEGHIATITKSSHDSSLVGRRFKVDGFHHQTHATARRLPVKEIS